MALMSHDQRDVQLVQAFADDFVILLKASASNKLKNMSRDTMVKFENRTNGFNILAIRSHNLSRSNAKRISRCSQGTIQSGGASVMVWDVCSWRDMEPLIRLETTLTGDRYLSILSDHLHSLMSIVHSDGLGQFQQDNATPHASRVVTKSGCRNTLLTLDTYIGHLNPQRLTLLKICGMPCYILLRRDLHHLALLWIC
ncbi:hypothetical protein AVEN_182860-1 [Araneus ventricosus]|uniref:Uncharacterized protein n=1 Tax=Araneus ventricosus TaxID=182803 RepID=A0A4Y2RXD2_ARAVE|nr:hypothetical protein AVEN_168169-1 [Araneus ventricosus]GBN79647.1 hypothetical protein AVEN_182860-1 [Araneus ventricosus]